MTIDPLELLRIENRELRALLHTTEKRLKLFAELDAKNAILTQILSALAVDAGGELTVAFEKIEAAMQNCGFRLAVNASKRDDGNSDARVVVWPLTDEERKQMNQPNPLPTSKRGGLILPG